VPIASLQRRLTQVGVIRLGEKRISQKTGKPYPAALENFRITSPSKTLVEAVAGLYGGTVRPWQNTSGPEFEVVTRSTEMPVFVPPQSIDPNFELWGGGYKARQCDGIVEKLRGQPCMCEQAARARYAKAQREFPDDGRFERDPRSDCKPTTRMSLMLAEVASMGTWKLEAHGWNAASELPMLAEAIASATQPIPATLRLEQRGDLRLKMVGGRPVVKDGKEEVETRSYVVPVLDFAGLFTPQQAFGGQLDSAVRQAVGGREQRPAIAATPVQAEAKDWLAEIAVATTTAQLDALKDEMRAGGVRDGQIVAAWRSRGSELAPAAPTDVPRPAPAVASVAAVEAEAEPDRDEVWTTILREAAKQHMNLPTVEVAYRKQMGHDPTDDAATGWKYRDFLTALRAGQVSA
jgi:hypothetical protein